MIAHGAEHTLTHAVPKLSSAVAALATPPITSAPNGAVAHNGLYLPSITSLGVHANVVEELVQAVTALKPAEIPQIKERAVEAVNRNRKRFSGKPLPDEQHPYRPG